MDSHNEEYEGNASQRGESGEADLIELDEDDEDETADQGAQRPITTWHQSTGSQRSILTVRATPTESLDRRIGYPRRKTPGVGPITQNPPTSGRPAVLRTVSNVPVTAIPTPTHSGRATPEFDGTGLHVTRSRRNTAVGIELIIQTKAKEIIWDWTLFTNPFPDPITLTGVVADCWSDARLALGFEDFDDATPDSIDQVSSSCH